MIDKNLATAMCQQIIHNLASMPEDVLQEAKKRMEIDAHNAKVDAAKRAKRKKRGLR